MTFLGPALPERHVEGVEHHGEIVAKVALGQEARESNAKKGRPRCRNSLFGKAGCGGRI